MHAWFLKIVSVQTSVCVFVCVCVCVCVSAPRLIITSGVMCGDMDYIRLVNKSYSCYMATVAIMVNGTGLVIRMHRRH